jgi:hypothetical protein
MRPEQTDDAENHLAVYLLDLRSEYEAELRLLTEVQRSLERFRSARTAAVRVRAKEMLMQQMRLLNGANRAIHDALAQSEPLVHALEDPTDRTVQ